ncbi:isochorismatase family protein [Streptomyces sp. NPDC058683]|uniref:isochorismatase family protein n=1 Tax=Streptomyces sp. NPDC058683 TaxID=3346597 RepID=UPI0036581DB9
MMSRDTAPHIMPEPALLPPDRSGWAVDPRRAALLVLNVQNHFVHVLRESSVPVDGLVAGIGRLAATARAARVPVLYSVSTAERGRDGRGAAFGHPHFPREDGSGDVVSAVRPRVGDTVLTAKRFSAFAGTRLRQLLTELERDQPVIVGVFARTQVMLTAADAWMQDGEPRGPNGTVPSGPRECGGEVRPPSAGRPARTGGSPPPGPPRSTAVCW